MSITAYDRDYEVVQRMKPEPMTKAEEAAQGQVDDVEFEIFKHKMSMIAMEGKETTMKLGASTAMRWGDVAFGIFTAQGDLSVCATGIYHHAVLGQIPLKYIVKHWVDEPSVGAKDGDSFFYNDSFYAGVHNADMGLAVPVISDGKILCFVGAAVHTGEAGGSEPGGMCTSARTIYDEGMMVPPIKIGENHALKEDVLAMLAAGTRDARTMILDIKARLAAVRTAERRIKDFVDEVGEEFFIGSLRKLLNITGEAARRKVGQLNDGVYRQPRFLDIVGPDKGLMKIGMVVTKKGDKLHLDLTNSSPLVPDRPMNSYYQGLIGLVMVYFCGWFFHDLPPNNGLLEAIDWTFPEDSFVNSRGDASVSLAPMIQTCFVQGMFMCGARMTYGDDPGHAVAAWFTGFSTPVYAGVNQFGEPMADIPPEINATGAGARYDMDGVDGAGAFFATVSDCSDVESTESDRPFIYTFRNFFNNSYGNGKYRGGAGVGFGFMVHHVPAVGFGAFGTGSDFPATLGIFGGYAVPPTFIHTVSGGNLKDRLAAGDPSVPGNLAEVFEEGIPEDGESDFHAIIMRVRPLANGDTFYVPVGGGAGYGDVLERDPESVMTDLRDGRVTHEVARNLYKVIYEEDSLRLDGEATAAAREAAREARKTNGKSYDEFNNEWERLRPPDEVLRFYGSFPNPIDGAGELETSAA